MRGELVLTDEGLFNYWQQEWVICTDRIHHLETTLAGMTAPSRDDPREAECAPQDHRRLPGTPRDGTGTRPRHPVQLDPEGRVFNAADYIENYADTYRPGKTTARSTLS